MTKATKILASALALAGCAVARPAATTTTTTASDGFPTPNAQQLHEISVQADGSLSNGPPPPKLANSTLQSFQAIAFNEEFEVAFFKSLLANITNDVNGYRSWNGIEKAGLEKIFKKVVAQEELHALNAIDVLEHFNELAPMPCQYHFPTTDIVEAVAEAEAFTGLVLGALQDVSQAAAASGDNAVVRAVASVIGQEGEQQGFYRLVLGRVPSESPFLTTAVGPYLFSYVLNNFVVPNSCPFEISALGIPVFPQLFVESGKKGFDVEAKNQTIKFSADLTGNTAAQKYVNTTGEGLYITYLSGQLQPISVPVQNATWSSDKITFNAFFPYEANIMDGLSIAALTTSNNFTGPDDLPGVTLAAPGLINVNDEL